MMGHFPDKLKVSPLFGGKWRKRRLLANFAYHMAPGAIPIVVPRNFITDYASIPRFLWSWIPAWGQHGPAAIVHDYLYSGRLEAVPDPDEPRQVIVLDRQIADQIFLLAMRQTGVGWAKRIAIYSAVRACGKKHFKGD